MARITFKEGSPIQSLSGTLGNMNFRVRNGKTFVHAVRQPELSEDASRAEKARHKRQEIVHRCVCLIQEEIEDVKQAIAMRSKIRSRMLLLYDRFLKETSAPTKLSKMIMVAYRKKWGKSSDSLVEVSRKSRK